MSLFVSVPVAGVGSYDLNPNYNLRFFFPAVLAKALEGLYEERWESWYASYLREKGITEKQLIDGWAKFSAYLRACLEGLPQDRPRDALKQCGFMDLPEPVKLVLLAKIGQLMTASTWLTMRECTRYAYLPVEVTHIEELGRRLQKDLLGGSDGN